MGARPVVLMSQFQKYFVSIKFAELIVFVYISSDNYLMVRKFHQCKNSWDGTKNVLSAFS
jgi:hypothetical protein